MRLAATTSKFRFSGYRDIFILMIRFAILTGTVGLEYFRENYYWIEKL
ncbi:hypothetical protein NC99_31520 [Sunxiuqinia dokdonensis]|uniref:Uncharacterized protein n=1 Tax=Sunxiuqinia dokdonensis TaxID=1409788 RepID=A0A0L8V6V5_9BACT|nr:hypothetical protein NC99_31520 [Sunxiuqinia dokdonensis]